MKGKNNRRSGNYKGRRGDRPNIKDRDHLTDTGATTSDTPEKQIKDPKLCSLNDISWYNRYPELLKAAASIPYPYRPGVPMKIGSIAAKDGSQPANNSLLNLTSTIPGILSLNWMPCIPKSFNATDAVAIAAREIYARVRKAYSGRLYADAPDFIMFLLALDSIYAYIGWLHRVYRTLCAYTPDNLYTPDGLLQAYGFSNDAILNLKQDQMKFFQNITELIHMVSKFNCPAEFDLMNRHYWMSRNVYSDGPGLNTQLYVFNLVSVWDFGMVNTPDGVPAGGLKNVVLSSAMTSVDSLFAFGKKLIDDLSAWEDSYTISGYLARAFEGSPMFMPDFPVVNEDLTFEYQPEVLSQIENSYTNTGYPGATASASGFLISQDPKTNSVIFNPLVYIDSNTPQAVKYIQNYRLDRLTHMLNIHSNGNPTPEDTVIASRLRTVVDNTGWSSSVPLDESVTMCGIICGTEWLFDYTLIAQLQANGSYTFNVNFTNQAVYDFSGTATGSTLNVIAAIDAILRQFDWAPCREVIIYDPTNHNLSSVIHSWDLFNATLINDDDLLNIHRICSYSELNAFSI